MTRTHPTVAQLIRQFLADHSHGNANTYAWYKQYLVSFRTFAGEERAYCVTPSLVNKWLAERYHTKAPSTKHAAARAVVRLYNWSVDEQLIERSPLLNFRKPTPGRREVCLTPAQYATCVQHSFGPLRDVVKFLWHTGARPQELRIIEADWLAGRKIVFPMQQSKGKRRRRVIYLDNMATGIVTRLAERWPHGSIFRTTRGEPWTRNALVLAFRRLRKRTEIAGLCAYTMRHSFITRLLTRGTDVATVAALSGNSPRMVLEVYAHVADDEDRLLRLIG